MIALKLAIFIAVWIGFYLLMEVVYRKIIYPRHSYWLKERSKLFGLLCGTALFAAAVLIHLKLIVFSFS